VLLVGGLGGKLATNRILDYTGSGYESRKLCSLHLSLMNRIGVKADCFGAATAQLAGLEPRSASRAGGGVMPFFSWQLIGSTADTEAVVGVMLSEAALLPARLELRGWTKGERYRIALPAHPSFALRTRQRMKNLLAGGRIPHLIRPPYEEARLLSNSFASRE
jgi:hypothetical protein